MMIDTQGRDFTISTFFEFLAVTLLAALLSACQTAPSDASSPASEARPGGHLLYLASSLGPATEMRRIEPSGESTPVLASRQWRDLHPDLAPDGRLAFMSNRREEPALERKRKERFRVFVLAPDEQTPEPISETEHSAITPRFSPDGQWLAYLHARPRQAALMLHSFEQGKAHTRLTVRDILDFAWSPDGEQLAVVVFSPGNSHLALIEREETADSSVLKIRPEEDGAVISGVSFSPDGRHLAYIVNSPDRARRLYLYDLDSGERRRISDPEHHVQKPVRWSRDSRRLLYASLVDFDFYYDEEESEKIYEGSMQVFLSDLDGETRQLTQGEGRHGMPVFSPDEQSIAYLYGEHLEARELSLRLLNLEGKEERLLSESVAPESFLQWTDRKNPQ